MHRMEVERASAGILAVDADSDVDSCWADTAAVQAIADKQELQDPSKVVREAGSFLALDPTPAADSSDLVAMLVALPTLTLAAQRMETERTLGSAVSRLVDSATSLEIVDSTDCC